MNLAQLIDLAEMATVRRALRASAHCKAQCSAALSTQAGTLSWCLQSSLHHSLAARSAECARRTSSCGRSAMLRRRSPRCSARRCRRRHVVGRLRCCCCKVLCASWLHPPSSCAARVNSPTAAQGHVCPTGHDSLRMSTSQSPPALHCTALHCTAQHSTAQPPIQCHNSRCLQLPPQVYYCIVPSGDVCCSASAVCCASRLNPRK